MGNRNNEQNMEMYAIARNVLQLEDKCDNRGDDDFVVDEFKEEVKFQASRLKKFILSAEERELMRDPENQNDDAAWVLKDRLDSLYAEFKQQYV